MSAPDTTAPAPRRFQSCASCSRQYDVTHLASGERVRCDCGQSLVVETHATRAPRPLKCANCGGLLEVSARQCGYCSAEVTLEERRLDSVCPVCFARMASDAHFCMECGVKIQPQARQALPENAECPRCKGALRSRAVGERELIECASCGGLWLSHAQLEALCDDASHRDLARRALGELPTPPRPADDTKVAWLTCPMCRDIMTRKNYAQISGVIVDVCRRDGVWLDHRELARVLDFVRQGGLEKAQRREVERLKEDKRRAEAGMTAGPAELPDFEPRPRGPRKPGWIGIVELLLELVSGR